MSSLTHLTLLHANDKATAALRFGFEREGTDVASVQDAESLQESIDNGSQLIITGGKDKADAEKKLALIEGVIAGTTSRVRVLYFGNSITRDEALIHGAHEFLTPPAFIRDVVTLSKLMATPMERRTQSISGELSEHFGLFYLMRALGMVNYTGVLTLLRGLRRGELRFYDGEVTSSQMGSLHGLAALHQSLLWTHARFDLRDEQTVHRRQIPLERSELLSECERFLSEIRSVADGLSPSAVLEQNSEKDAASLPEQVGEILCLFDGTCSVADIIEDSPYRVFETLRIACRLLEQGFVRSANSDAPKHLMHTALAIEEWLVGGAAAAPAATEETTPPGPAKGEPASPPEKGKQRGRRKASDSVPPPVSAVPPSEQGWSDLLPSVQSTADIAQVVPATDAVGEISARPSSRASRVGGTEPPPMPERERLEERGGVASLANIFIDESLGAEQIDSEKQAIADAEAAKASPVDPTQTNDSWEEETAPAKRQALVDFVSSDSEAEETSLPEPAPSNKKDSKSSALKPSTTAPAASSDEEAPKVESVEAESSSDDEVSKAESVKAESPDTETASGPSEAEIAHAIVAQTAKDAALAISAIMSAAAKDVGIFLAPSKKRADSKSEQDAQDVADLASAAEAAGTEASHFSVEEEAFFHRGQEEAAAPAISIESFDDLDDDYEIPRTFWQRFLSNPDMRQRKKKKN